MPIQKLSHNTDFVIPKANSDLAVTELNTQWTAMLQADKDTWATATVYGTDDLSGKNMFLAFYTGTFIGDYSEVTSYATTTLGAGTGADYAQRASRTWTVA